LLAGGALSILVGLAVLVFGSPLVPQPEVVAAVAARITLTAPPPTLADFWAGRAVWQLDVPNAGLPIGESDTLIAPDGKL
jgi:hypothetical protein